MAAVAADGFVRFGEAIAAAAAAAAPTEAFEQACLAYIGFGQSNLGVYRLMFASNLLRTFEGDEVLHNASAAAFAFLLEGVSTMVAAEEAVTTAVSVWATLHGVVMLNAEGLLSGPVKAAMTPEPIVHALVSRLRASGRGRRAAS